MRIKDTYKFVIILLVIILAILPLATAVNEILTRIVEDTNGYRLLQKLIVPYVSKIIIAVLQYLPGIEVGMFPFGVIINGVDVRITWNCLGWQSFLLFFASCWVGLRNNHSALSKIQALAFGLAGTFIVNIFKIVFTAALVGRWRGLFVILFHDYFSSFVAIIWLFFFWWFAYSFILEEGK